MRAIDLNGDELTWSLVGPPGMTIDETGLHKWNPEVGGVYRVTIEVEDSGESATQQFELIVLDNAPPAIRGEPLLVWEVETAYTYDLNVFDANEDDLTYRLLSNHPGMSIDSSGELTWIPDEVGEYRIDVLVDDGHGGQDTKSFTLGVKDPPNDAPEIVSSPRLSIQQGRTYFYQVEVEDADYDTISFEVEGPGGMTINSAGLIEWTPQAFDVWDERRFTRFRLPQATARRPTRSRLISALP